MKKSHKIKMWTPYLVLLTGIILFIFSNGRLSVPFAAWIAPVFLLGYTRAKKPLRGLALLFILMALSTRIMLHGIIPSSLGVLTYILTIYYAILWFLPYLADRFTSKKIPGYLQTLVLPVTAVAFEYINNLFFGSWASIAYTQFNNLALIQVGSITGMWGVTFIVMWFASVLFWVIDNQMKWSTVSKGVLIFSGTMSLVLLYGGFRLEVFKPKSDTVTVVSFTPTEQLEEYMLARDDLGYKSSLQMAKKDRTKLSSLLQEVYDAVFDHQESVLRPEVSITLWPEGMLPVLDEDEDAFIERGCQLARRKNVYLLMAYLLYPIENPDQLAENKCVLINPDGIAEWEYLKAYPVPGSTDKAGDGILPVSNTPFGKVSAAICYDMDFTALINQAGRKDIDLMLVPAWDWLAINPLHARMAVFRAIENGFSMVRQTGEGLSIATDYHGRTLTSMDHFNTNDRTMQAKLPVEGVRTVYALIGDSFAWLCIFLFVCFIAWPFMKKKPF
jgi:apolipoprotein N-acyltransferase